MLDECLASVADGETAFIQHDSTSRVSRDTVFVHL